MKTIKLIDINIVIEKNAILKQVSIHKILKIENTTLDNQPADGYDNHLASEDGSNDYGYYHCYQKNKKSIIGGKNLFLNIKKIIRKNGDARILANKINTD